MDRYNTPQVSQAQQASQQASSTASQAAQSATTLPDMLREALGKKLGTDNPTMQAREGALTNYLNTSTQAPIDYTHTSAGGRSDVIYSPMEQANLIQGRRSSALAPLTSLNDLLGLQYGGLDNVIGATSRAAQAQVAGLQENAQMKRQEYMDLIDIIGRQADEDYRYAALNKESGGGSDLATMIAALRALEGESAGGLDDLIEDEVMGPPGPPAGYKAPSRPLDIRGANVGFGLSGGSGMGNIPLSSSQPKKQTKERLPSFLSLEQLGL